MTKSFQISTKLNFIEPLNVYITVLCLGLPLPFQTSNACHHGSSGQHNLGSNTRIHADIRDTP